MMVNKHVLHVQLDSHVIQEILLESQLAQLECTHSTVNRLANLALQDLCVLTQMD